MILNDVTNEPSEPVSFGMPWHGAIVNTTLTLPNSESRTVSHSYPVTNYPTKFLHTRGWTRYVKFAGLSDPEESEEQTELGMDFKNDAVLFGYTGQYHYASTSGVPALYRDDYGFVWKISASLDPPTTLTWLASSGSVSIVLSAIPYGVINAPESYSSTDIATHSDTLAMPSNLVDGEFSFSRTIFSDEWKTSPRPYKPPETVSSPDGSTFLMPIYYRQTGFITDSSPSWQALKIYKASITSGAYPGAPPTAAISAYWDEEACIGWSKDDPGTPEEYTVYGYTEEYDPGPPQTRTFSPSESSSGLEDPPLGLFYPSAEYSGWHVPLVAFDQAGNEQVWTVESSYTRYETRFGSSEASGTLTYNSGTGQWEGTASYEYTNGNTWEYTHVVELKLNGLQVWILNETADSSYGKTVTWAHPDSPEETEDYTANGSSSLGGSYSTGGYSGIWSAGPPNAKAAVFSSAEHFQLIESVTNNVCGMNIGVYSWEEPFENGRYRVISAPGATEDLGFTSSTDKNGPYAVWNPRDGSLSYSDTDTLGVV